jgi:phage terminase large subunit GpA-like protein
VSQWADNCRQLSSEASAAPGQWDTSQAEYQREIMDAFNDPEVEGVVMMSSAQVGKTEILNNVVGYFIDYDPCPILVVQPNEKPMGEAWSKDRLTPMLRDTPSLRAKVAVNKGRDSGNTIFHKVFPGGQLSIAGANAPAGLASRPKRVILFDEIDRYPASAGTEGDPIELGKKRSTTFWNRKHGEFSTPTVKGRSRIEKAFELSDQRYRMCPCPCGCGHAFRLTWSMVVWGKDSPAQGDPEKAVYQCPSCLGYFDDIQKEKAVQLGRWVATAPFKGIAGFHLSELYSPWRTLKQIVRSFLEAKGDPSRMQVWVNTCLGETFEETGEQIGENELLERVEKYEAEVPARGLYVTGGADVQPDRIEIEFVAWGAGEESWSIGYHIIHGDVDIPEGSPGSPWTHFTDLIRKRFKHESGVEMVAESICIDTGGTGENTQSIYNYCKRHKGDRLFAVKGKGGPGLPIVGPPNRKRSGKNKRPVDLYIVGTNNAKAVVMKRFKIAEPGAGYCHFPEGRPDEYYRQLAAEKAITKFVKGFPVIEWTKPKDRRNEALDCRVYAFAALVLRSPQFDKLAFRMKMAMERRRTAAPSAPVAPAPEPEPDPFPDKTAQDPAPPAADSPRKTRRPRRGGFVNSWR